MSAPATRSGDDGTSPPPDALVDDLLVAVCRPEDVAGVRTAVAEVDPDDLGGLVAVVGEYQPMSLEVTVDVLAELGASPTAIARALAIDREDVVVLLGGPLTPPAPRGDGDARIIEVASRARAGADLPTGDDEPADDRADPDGDRPGTDTPADLETDDGPPDDDVADDDVTAEGSEDVEPETDSDRPVAVVIDDVAEDEAVARTVADLEGDGAGSGRPRWIWVLVAVVVVLLVAGGYLAAQLL